MKIIFLSNQLFDFPLKTNKWHVATRVAERSHQVLFVDPPIRLQKLAKQILEGHWSPRRILTSSYNGAPKKGQTPASPAGGLFLAVFTPLSLSVSESPNLTDLNVRLMKKRFSDFFDGKSILWVYNPAMDEYIGKIPHQLLVYDCVDDYPSMANYVRLGLSEEIARKEEEIARRADVVFATTETLARKLSAYNKNVHYVGNAGDYERFAPVGKDRLKLRDEIRHSGFISESNPKFEILNPKQILNSKSKILNISDFEFRASDLFGASNFVLRILDRVPHPRIGFTGAIDEYKLNLPLLIRVAKACPEYSFVVVGPQAVADTQPDLSELKRLSNVYFIGQRPYEEMPSFFASFDCYIIPYNLNDYTLKGCFPVKFFDALAAGLPTVVTNLPSYASFSEVCYLAKSDEEFTRAIQIALEEDSPEKIKARMEVAQENSWDNKVEKMLDIVSEVLRTG